MKSLCILTDLDKRNLRLNFDMGSFSAGTSPTEFTSLTIKAQPGFSLDIPSPGSVVGDRSLKLTPKATTPSASM
jgi:hypothetical protein